MPKLGFMLNPPQEYPEWGSFGDALGVLADAGFDGVELGLGDPADVDVERLEVELARRELRLCGIGTGAAYLRDGLCLSSPDAAVRHGAVDRLRAHIDLAARFGAIVVIGLLLGLKSDEPDRDVANTRAAGVLLRVAENAERRRVQLVLEPVNRFEAGHNHTAAEVLELIDRVGSPALTIMLDTFHINIEESSLDGPVRLAANRLGHVHVFENHRGLFGTGHVDLGLILRATLDVGYGGYWVLGDFSGNPLRVRAAAAMDFLRRAGLKPMRDR